LKLNETGLLLNQVQQVQFRAQVITNAPVKLAQWVHALDNFEAWYFFQSFLCNFS